MYVCMYVCIYIYIYIYRYIYISQEVNTGRITRDGEGVLRLNQINVKHSVKQNYT